ncbi:MAG: pirin family protein [Pseudomonadota bacterium]
MIQIRKSEDRGHANHGWLDARHSFSFSNYYDPAHMNFRQLRVINEDKIAPGGGFPMHSHENMEIITYIVDGAIEHRDDMGNGEVLGRGEIQRMSAGTGVTHSEFNPSDSASTHLLQIWVMTAQNGIAPDYEQTRYDDRLQSNDLCLVLQQGGRDGIAHVNQDIALYTARLDSGKSLEYASQPDRYQWLQLVRGDLSVNGVAMSTGDGAAISDENLLNIAASNDAEFLLFDLA